MWNQKRPAATRTARSAELTFEKAFEMAQLYETAEKNSKELNATPEVHRTSTVTQRSNDRVAEIPPCYRCGGQHHASKCRFKTSICNFCKKKGHIQSVCRVRLRQAVGKGGPNDRETRRDAQRRDSDRAHRIEEPPPEHDPQQVDYNMFAVFSSPASPFTVQVELQGAPLTMEIDTGAALSLISKATYSQLWPEQEAPTLEKTLIRLRTYTGEELKLVGKVVVKVCYGS